MRRLPTAAGILGITYLVFLQNFTPKLWASLDLRYQYGGETTTDGVKDDNRIKQLGGGVALGDSAGVCRSGTGNELVAVGIGDGFLASGGVTGITVVQAARATAANTKGAIDQARSFTLRFSDMFTSLYHREHALTKETLPFVWYPGHFTLTIKADELRIAVHEYCPGFSIDNFIVELYLTTPHTFYPTANCYKLVITRGLPVTQA